MKDKPIWGTVSEGRSLSLTFDGLSKENQHYWCSCYEEATKGCQPLAVQAYDSYEKCPISIKTDILTLGIDNNAVFTKIVDWMYNNYIDPLLK